VKRTGKDQLFLEKKKNVTASRSEENRKQKKRGFYKFLDNGERP